MSLRSRLVLTISCTLFAIMLLAGLLTYVHSQRKVEVEMGAARNVALNTILRMVSNTPPEEMGQRLREIVRVFDGDRHVKVALLDGSGGVHAQSRLAPPPNRMPDWFYSLMAPPPGFVHVRLPDPAGAYGRLIMQIDPRNEISEVWESLGLSLTVLGLFALCAGGSIYFAIGRALRPLGPLSSALGEIGRGHYAVSVKPAGPPELAGLCCGVNDMAAKLTEMDARNRRLSEQLLRLQDEERAELARDLHDEVGPFLFAIDVDASGIETLAGRGGQPSAIAERAKAIKNASLHAKMHVRRILGQLRPGLLSSLGLAASIDHMLSLLRKRHPGIVFEADVEEGEWGPEINALINLIVREAVNNALKHAGPSRISVEITETENGVAFTIADDGCGFDPARAGHGYGLIGMQERIRPLGGSVSVTAGRNGRGTRVEGTVPLRSAGVAGGSGTKERIAA